MELSIIIVNYKSRKYLEKCLESIKRYPPSIPYEVIVIDNDKDNVGYAKGCNKGIRKAKGKYILLLNPDTEVKKDSLELLYEFARITPDAGVVGSRLLDPSGDIQPSAYRFPSIKNAVLEYWFAKKGSFEKYIPKGETPVEVDFVVGAAFLITPQALKKVGLLDERYFMYFEDLDYCRRLKPEGLKTYYYPKAEIIHYHGVSGRDVAEESNQWRRLIPSSKIYHGVFKHYLINGIIWLGQKWQKLFS